jgi:lycopene cyclase domain-containing protein
VSLAYLGCVLIASAALVLLDRRFALVFWRDARRTGVVLIVGLAFFLSWDEVGIGSGVFARGRSPFMAGVELAPELPVEEPVFLTFLCYLTLVLLSGGRALIDAQRRRAAPVTPRALTGQRGRRR